MVHFLRNRNNQTIIECDVSTNDLHSSVDLEIYTKEFIVHYTTSNSTANDFMSDISNLDQIRGWWWEKENEFGDWKSIDAFVKAKFVEVADKWGLCYVTD